MHGRRTAQLQVLGGTAGVQQGSVKYICCCWCPLSLPPLLSTYHLQCWSMVLVPLVTSGASTSPHCQRQATQCTPRHCQALDAAKRRLYSTARTPGEGLRAGRQAAGRRACKGVVVRHNLCCDIVVQRNVDRPRCWRQALPTCCRRNANMLASHITQLWL